MRRYGYHEGLASASVCAGGTLGILIPPSVIMVIYGIMTSTDIAKLFIAGILPGLVAIALYSFTVQYLVWRNSVRRPARRAHGLARAAYACLAMSDPSSRCSRSSWAGCISAPSRRPRPLASGHPARFAFSLWRRKMTWRDFLDCAVETARITAALFAILIGALLFSQLMNFGGFPRALQAFVTGFGVEPYVVIVTICVLYIVLGTFFEELSMILLTVPIFFPLVVGLGFDPIWFGIVIVMVVEMGLISPPVGMNLFVVQSLLKIPVGTLYRWITPFIIADIIRLGLIIAFPIIVLFLPRLAG